MACNRKNDGSSQYMIYSIKLCLETSINSKFVPSAKLSTFYRRKEILFYYCTILYDKNQTTVAYNVYTRNYVINNNETHKPFKKNIISYVRNNGVN